MTQRRILIVTHDLVGENMAGPAIRCWEFARVLSQQAAVTLATPFPTDLDPETFRLVEYDAHALMSLAAESDVIILSGYTLWKFPFLASTPAALVVDIYDPFLLETLPLLAGEPDGERNRKHGDILDALTDLLVWGDFFLCASERQRDYWLGWLNAVDRINPATYDEDPTLRRLIDVVEFGMPDGPPVHTRRVLKGVHPGIAETDHVILWAGGVYNWFDPLTLIRALERVAAQRTDVKLVFLGIGHPNPEVDHLEMADRAVALSRDLGLYEQSVFFYDWTPYHERANYLLEADVGVSLHFAHLETHFSFRTRLLDHIWTALPTIVTRGDVLSTWVAEQRLGWVVDYEDVDGVVAAILESCARDRALFQPRFEAAAAHLAWPRVMQPLVEFCRNPHPAADRERARSSGRALPLLRLVSELGALRRELGARDDRVAFLENVLREREATIADLERRVLIQEVETRDLRDEIAARDVAVAGLQAERERLEQHIHQVEQGRVMRLLNGIQHIARGPGERA
ncbi:MAG: glycosyltransferase family 1 protein [Anaerolineae bacterium]|nr:glycosyltransferase family 1 protein [Anaerolineae bacterium]